MPIPAAQQSTDLQSSRGEECERQCSYEFWNLK
jgi:hypothetical protein